MITITNNHTDNNTINRTTRNAHKPMQIVLIILVMFIGPIPPPRARNGLDLYLAHVWMRVRL